MNYYIAFINESGFDWCIITSTDREYITKIFDNIAPPPEYSKELRATPESIDTHLSYEVIKGAET